MKTKIKITAKCRALRCLRFEDTKTGNYATRNAPGNKVSLLSRNRPLIWEFWTAFVPKIVEFLALIHSYLYADHVIRL